MSKKFLLDLPDAEHQSLKLAAVQAGESMHTFIRDAIKEKVARQSEAARGVDTNDGVVLAKASEKPA